MAVSAKQTITETSNSHSKEKKLLYLRRRKVTLSLQVQQGISIKFGDVLVDRIWTFLFDRFLVLGGQQPDH